MNWIRGRVVPVHLHDLLHLWPGPIAATPSCEARARGADPLPLHVDPAALALCPWVLVGGGHGARSGVALGCVAWKTPESGGGQPHLFRGHAHHGVAAQPKLPRQARHS